MDARAQLALMVKAKLVFENPDTFLSFPALSPLSYAPDQLRFLPAAHDMSVFAECSRLSDVVTPSTAGPRSQQHGRCIAHTRFHPLRRSRQPRETPLFVTRHRSIHSRISLRISGNSTWAQSNSSMRQSVSLPYWR